MRDISPTALSQLADYIANALPPEEILSVERWIEAHPERHELLRYMLQARLDLRKEPESEELQLPARVDAISKSIAAAITQRSPAAPKLAPTLTNTDAKPRGSRYPSKRAWYALSACVCGFVLLLASWRKGDGSISIGTTRHSFAYTTANAERATITLPDGSTVLLNVASRLEVPVDYDRGNRTLRLEGEAFFTVSHHQGRPFTVIAGPSTTRVLGTSFLVRHYVTDTAATVAVRDGRVMVQSQVLAATQQVTVSTNGSSSVRAASANRFSFVSGVLVFSGMQLYEAIPQLNRWYDADIRLSDSTLAVRTIVGGFKAGSLTDLSAILEMMFTVRVVRDGRVLTLYPNGQ